MSDLLDRIMDHCRTKLGVTTSDVGDFTLLGGFLDTFAGFYPDESPPVAILRVHDEDRTSLEGRFHGVRKSDKMRWDTKGWTWTDVPVDGSVPEETLVRLVDRSYQLVVDGKDDDTRPQLDLIRRGLPPRELLAELIERYGLGHRRQEIEALAEPALLLRTTQSDEDELPLGRSRVGGRPDLPPGVAWPRHSSGKPLAFLAQINLADAAAVAKLPALPQAGLLHVFSVYGWQNEGEWDPDLPDGTPAEDWTRVLYHPISSGLERQTIPPEVNAFPGAAAEFVSVLSLPGDEQEPGRAALGLEEDEQEQLQSLYWTYEAVTLYLLGNPPRHQLLGYGSYEQGIPGEVAAGKIRLLFQLASDGRAEMMWGDGGHVYFLAPPAAVGQGDFSQVVTDYQCG